MLHMMTSYLLLYLFFDPCKKKKFFFLIHFKMIKKVSIFATFLNSIKKKSQCF